MVNGLIQALPTAIWHVLSHIILTYTGCKCNYGWLRKVLNPLPDDWILDSSKLKEFAVDNFKFDENGRKLSKQLESTVGKGEIARYEQNLLFPQCFQKTCFLEVSKGVIVWEWVNSLPHNPN